MSSPVSKDERRALARRGERDAARFLKEHGHKILASNYACPIGELDLIALCDGVLIFVEVKAKSGLNQCPEEAVDFRKRRKLSRVADYFINAGRLDHLPCQFDVVAVNYDPEGQAHVSHFPDAFDHV